MKWLDDITYSIYMSLSKLRDIVKEREALGAAVHGVTNIRHSLVTEQQHEINECEMSLKIDLFYQKKSLSLEKSPWNFLNLPM